MARLVSKRTAWTRIWTGTHGGSLSEGLAMRVADPCWMLGRQYQMGALIGDDAASPVRVEMTRHELNVTKIRPGHSGRWRNIAQATPLEVQVEPMDHAEGPAALLHEARTGLQFLRLFPEVERSLALAQAQKAAAFTEGELKAMQAYPAVLAVMRGSVHGGRLAEASEDLARVLGALAGLDEDAITRRHEAWKVHAGSRIAIAPGSGYWRDDRLSYGFQTRSATGGNKSIVLKADAHDGGRIDWFSFDVGGASPGLRKLLGADSTETAYPTPVRYAGMPADTLWDFEDNAVHFGGLGAERTDLAQLLLTEFATVFSNDWFLVPLRARTGTLQRIAQIVVHDTYGDSYTVRSMAANDGARLKAAGQGVPRPNRFFEIEGDISADHATAPRTPWLYLPRVLDSTDHGRVLERVVFSRDEAANLAWGIETTVETPAGRPRDRAQEWARLRDGFSSYKGQSDMPEADPELGHWVYRLLTGTAPPHWVPFIPEVEANMPTGRLRRARLQDWDLLGPDKDRIAGPQGALMPPRRPFVVNDEEVMQGGTEVTRAYQAARGPDGRLHVWLANRRRPAEPVESAGRLTDVIERGRKP